MLKDTVHCHPLLLRYTVKNANSVQLVNKLSILGFHYTIMRWIWVGVNLGCIDDYPVLEWTNDMKLHVFATKANTYNEHLI